MKANHSYKNKIIRALILLSIVTLLTGCDNKKDHATANQVIGIFEQAYLTALENIKADPATSARFLELKNKNFDSIRMIAFTWHSHASTLCGIQESRSDQNKATGYESLLNPSESLPIEISPSDLSCLSSFYEENIDAINEMITLHTK